MTSKEKPQPRKDQVAKTVHVKDGEDLNPSWAKVPKMFTVLKPKDKTND
jgi:hypothetical protein